MNTGIVRVADRMQQLADLITHHRNLYYNFTPEISDEAFDLLVDELRSLVRDYPDLAKIAQPLSQVGAPILSKNKVRHEVPMLSLDKVTNYTELQAWDPRGVNSFWVEPKFDGVAISLTYKDGILVRAATRGDGTEGEDVTENIKTVKNIPHRLRSTASIEVRGEIVILTKDLEVYNLEREKDGFPPFKNPRNTAAGALNQKDSQECAKRPLSFFAYGLAEYESQNLTKQSELFDYFRLQGLPSFGEGKTCNGLIEVQKYFEEVLSRRNSLSVEMDGLVVKVNSLEEQLLLGTHKTAPRWAVAYKFPSQSAVTEVLSIDLQIGRAGALTPVARVKPVVCAGVEISNITLHNPDEIKRLKVTIGSKVQIERAGDVIPKITKTLENSGVFDDSIFDTCPSCGSKTSRQHVVPVCTNHDNCPSQKYSRMYYFAAVMGMKGIGGGFIDRMVSTKIIEKYWDFYNLDTHKLINIAGFGATQSKNILDAVEKSKENGLASLLAAFGIPDVAYATAEKLVNAGKVNVDSIATKIQIGEVAGVSEPAVYSYNEYFANTDHVYDFLNIAKLLKIKTHMVASKKLEGMSFCFTGKISQPRHVFEQMVMNNGGTLKSVSKNLSYLVVGEKAGSKLAAAQSLGVKILTESEFLEMVK